MEERILQMRDQMAPLFMFLYIFSHCVSSGGDLHVGFVILMNMFLICIEEKKWRGKKICPVVTLSLSILMTSRRKDPPLTLNHFNQLVFHGKCLILDGDLL